MFAILVLAVIALAAGDDDSTPPPSTTPGGGTLPDLPPPPPLDDDDLPPKEGAAPPPTDDVALPDGCVWRLVADGESAHLCGGPGQWRPVVPGRPIQQTYKLPEQALTRVAMQLRLASAREIEIEGEGFHALVRRRSGAYDWRVQLADGEPQHGGADTVLDALGEVWLRTGAP